MVSLALALALAAVTPRMVPAPDRGEVRVRYLFSLTAHTGKTTLDVPGLSWDPEARELFVLFAGDLRVFNASGMEIYRFNRQPELGWLQSVTPLPGGDLLLWTVKEGQSRFVRCDFRGRPLGEFTLSGVPPDLVGIGRIGPFRAGDRLYFPEETGKRLAVTSLEGEFIAVRDLTLKFGDEEDKLEKEDLDRGGFWIDEKENVYFSFPLIFHVAVLGPDGKQRGFGQKGSTVGKFNVIGNLAADEDGYVYVADVLKSTVMVFNSEFRYVGQVAGIHRPAGILYGGGKLFVAQGRGAGVAVFEVLRN
ncbi:NHL repeat-containing protein [Anaeromyxobacter sp. Fw109-5]|uniref:NHL repeat-containing protein n=1 Tax=Anaeromyxobacter sp. (strain Fw109-5) TaxID=404589 RepID=UPI0000ED824B|nr:NHL repeat-containing protein [Anaeromyxobacter sp. Fw109-5]ABS26042.1 NHL repeat domain protein [Anaeromyxobacter sp. Fw109-5]